MNPSGVGVLARLREAGLLPRKALGQHFLHDPKLLAALVEEAGVEPGDRVLEVGTGPGTLTRELARRAERVLTIDVDPRMIRFAMEELKELSNIRFLEADVLERRSALRPSVEREIAALGPFVWVSNLPYSLATTLIVALLESSLPWARAALTVQAEVAERIAASPGTAAYGPVTALVAYWARARAGRKIPPGSFWPAPAVHSRLLHLVRAPPLGDPLEYPAYRSWVKRLFISRRKQLGGVLRPILGDGRARAVLEGLGLDARARPETLTPADFLRLARENPGFSH